MTPLDPRAEAELAAAFTRIHLGLAAADTDDAVLRAVAGAVVSHGPNVLRLYTLHDDDGDELPSSAELASVWHSGVCPAEDPLLGRRFDVADHPVLARWLAAPHQPLVLHDLAADPRPGALAQERSAQALVVLPLRAGAPPAWLGVLVLSWPIVHIPSPRERPAYDLIARAVAEALAVRRTLREHQRALDELGTFEVTAAALAESAGLDDVLAALSEPAQAAGATWAALWLRAGDGADARLVRVAPSPAGQAPERPLADLADLFARSDEPCLFEHVDPDILGPGARIAGVRAALLLPLVHQGRPLGLIELGWPAPRGFPRELQRLYTDIAGLAAAALVGRAALLGLAPDAFGGRVVVDVDTRAIVEQDPRVAALFAAHPELAAAHAAAVADALDASTIVRRTLELGETTFELLAGPELAEPGRATAVLQDISALHARERERLRARDHLLAAQATLLARQAVPVLPLSPTTVALPLVGPLDGARADQLAAVVAALPDATRAAILDLTHTPSVDPAAAAALAALLPRLRARGIDPILTGLRPEHGLADLPARPLPDALGAALLPRPA